MVHRKRQLKIINSWDLVFEWISYNQFFDIKEVDKDGFSTAYSAKWKDGPLYWNKGNKKYIRDPHKVTLKCLCNSQNSIDDFLNEV